MDLQEAWRYLAEKYEATEDRHGFIEIDSRNEWGDKDICGGVCVAVDLMWAYKFIEEHIWKWMREAVAAERARMKVEWTNLWPLSKDGARQRAAFCRAQERK